MGYCTYIAADFDHDSDAVDKLREWNHNPANPLNFEDVHERHQSSDDSLPCSIKKSLKLRMDESNRFILIVGDHTDTVTKGSCYYCSSYANYCRRGLSESYESYIDFECRNAVESGMKIVVLYKSASVNRSKCPETVRYKGTHVAMKISNGWRTDWDLNAVYNAIMF